MKIVYSYLNEAGQLVTSPAEITRGEAKGVVDLRVTPAEGRPFRVSNARRWDTPKAKHYSPAEADPKPTTTDESAPRSKAAKATKEAKA